MFPFFRLEFLLSIFGVILKSFTWGIFVTFRRIICITILITIDFLSKRTINVQCSTILCLTAHVPCWNNPFWKSIKVWWVILPLRSITIIIRVRITGFICVLPFTPCSILIHVKEPFGCLEQWQRIGVFQSLPTFNHWSIINKFRIIIRVLYILKSKYLIRAFIINKVVLTHKCKVVWSMWCPIETNHRETIYRSSDIISTGSNTNLLRFSTANIFLLVLHCLCPMRSMYCKWIYTNTFRTDIINIFWCWYQCIITICHIWIWCITIWKQFCILKNIIPTSTSRHVMRAWTFHKVSLQCPFVSLMSIRSETIFTFL